MHSHFTLYIVYFIVSTLPFLANAQGTESFSNMPANASNYAARMWTGDNGLTWNATDARTDQVMSGRAIVIRNGAVFCNNILNGIGSLSFNHQQFFTGSNPVLQVFINNNLVGTANPTTTQSNTVINNININGSFNLEIRQVTSGLRIGIDDVNWTSNSGVPCVAPAAQPTNLVLTATPTTISGSFTLPVPSADEYLVVRHTAAALSASPTDGTNYLPGTMLGGGTVVSVGSGSSFLSSGLSPATAYYFFVFSLNNDACSGGPRYLTTSPLQNNTSTTALPACVDPTNPPANLLLTPSNTTILGSFTAAANANRYLVIRSSDATLSNLPVNGVTYTNGQALGNGTVVAYSANNSFTTSALSAATLYYFFVFAANGDCSGEPVYLATPLEGSTTTTNSTTGIPPNYYTAATGLNCAPLKTALFSIISTNTNELTYTPGVWNAYQTTDLRRNDDNTATIIWDMYSDNPTGMEAYTYIPVTNQCGNYNSEGDCYNREHSFPSSWFNAAYPMYSDVHHLFPTDGYVNNQRGNFPFGEVGTTTYTSTNGSKLGASSFPGYTGTVFEPINEYKGDFARAHFYMVTRYEDRVAGWVSNGTAGNVLSGNTYPALDNWDIQLMYKWHIQDPVSQKEIDRNNAIYALQNNRNPFVDHPEYVAEVWGCTGLLPVTLVDFTGTLINGQVQLHWQAAGEINFSRYEVERSTDGSRFEKAGTIAGRNAGSYTWQDQQLPATSTVFYRLKMVDPDGKFSYSNTIVVRLANSSNRVLIYPNPTADAFTLQLNKPLPVNSSVVISDITGRPVLKLQVNARQQIIPLSITQLPAGRYIVTLKNSTELYTVPLLITR